MTDKIQNSKHKKTTVYFDGACYLCALEIAHYQKQDSDNRINFLDISSPSFDAAEHQLRAKEVHQIFHVKNPEGEILTKVDGFIQIWKELGVFKPLLWLSGFQLGRKVMDVGYITFAKIRPFLPRKKCETDACQI